MFVKHSYLTKMSLQRNEFEGIQSVHVTAQDKKGKKSLLYWSQQLQPPPSKDRSAKNLTNYKESQRFACWSLNKITRR